MHSDWKRPFVALTACLCVGLIMGCSDDDSTGDNNNTLPDASVDAAPDAATGDSVTFLIEAWSTAEATYVPAEGATVAFDAPGGERTELDTGADGRATFTGIDWTAGDAAVTIFLENYIMKSLVNIDAARIAERVDANGDYVTRLSLLQSPAPELVTVTGSATGLADVAHNVNVNTVNTRVQGTEWAGLGNATFSIDVPSGEPFVLQAVESEHTELPSGQGYDRPIYNVMHMDYGPITADETGVELDFGVFGMTTFTADVSVLMPPRVDSPLRTGNIPYCFFCAGNSTYCHGWPTYLDVVDNQSRIDISFLWVDPAYVQDPSWFCWVSTSSGEGAQIIIEGTPQQDATELLIDSPTWVTPANPLVAHPLHEPFEWQWYEDVGESSLEIGRSGVIVWNVIAGPNATTATVPLAPTGVNESVLLGSTSFVAAYGGTIDSAMSWVRYARGRAARVAP